MDKRAAHPGSGLVLALVAAAACSREPPDNSTIETVTGALTHSMSGTLMPFGGSTLTCVRIVGSGLAVEPCDAGAADGGTAENLTMVGSALMTSSGLCVDIQFGDLAAGVVDLTTCNGTVNQQWTMMGGAIVSANVSDGQTHCLDVRFGSTALGTPLDVAPCNGTAAQVFWPAGFTIDIGSNYVDVTHGNACECLDVLFDAERPGTTLDDSDCNGTNAQWYVPDVAGRLHLANNTGLCVTVAGLPPNGVAPVTLQNCISPPSRGQQWSFVNARTSNGLLYAGIKNALWGCLDVSGGNPQPATQVNSVRCNGTPEQRWDPRLALPICAG
jgi:hypothetical protein